MWIRTLEQGKRLVKIVVGFTILVLGVAMLVLPGPGILAICGGLALLSAEFVWARRLLDRLKHQARRIGDTVRRRRSG